MQEDDLSNIIQGIRNSVEKTKHRSKTPDSDKHEKKIQEHESSTSTPDYYKVIGCTSTDKHEIIVKKCNEMLAKYHPDKNIAKVKKYPIEEQKNMQNKYDSMYRLIRKASEFLKDPEKRKYYDSYRKSNEQRDFVAHKHSFDSFKKTQDNDITPEQRQMAELAYRARSLETDKKHGFDSSKNYAKDSYKFTNEDYSRRMTDLTEERDQQEAECSRENMFDGHAFDPIKFNRKFEQMQKRKNKHKTHRNEDTSIIKWEGVAAYNNYNDTTGNYVAITEDGTGYEDLYKTSKEADCIFADKLCSDDEKSLPSSDSDENIDVSYVKDYDANKGETMRAYEKIMLERDNDNAKFDALSITKGWGNIKDNPMNISAQMGDFAGFETLGYEREKKSKNDFNTAYNALMFDRGQK
ncbi:J domain-containing protein [Bodo saltans virus]|uniref:J domain-containing protein n=1 Tax=Bodo saltans virus TaxID=2024608 RepID=A0A2H4UUD4_9VIRU|nr:J domain-containing protein [Bodo saltans virus]ATZ80449.1 J domain-containing protein [Bodo saltans virus]